MVLNFKWRKFSILRVVTQSNTENVYQHLFSVVKGKRKIKKGKEVWILDEATKLGNRPILEYLKLAEKENVQLVFSGDSAQMASIDRGGMFERFCEKFGSQKLQNIQRQQNKSSLIAWWQKRLLLAARKKLLRPFRPLER